MTTASTIASKFVVKKEIIQNTWGCHNFNNIDKELSIEPIHVTFGCRKSMFLYIYLIRTNTYCTLKIKGFKNYTVRPLNHFLIDDSFFCLYFQLEQLTLT